VGGMLVPAVIYSIFNSGTEYSNGWGIPMATDIAFSLAIISMLGKKILTQSRYS
jgi:NhaA family Na+:H+ antiporter